LASLVAPNDFHSHTHLLFTNIKTAQFHLKLDMQRLWAILWANLAAS